MLKQSKKINHSVTRLSPQVSKTEAYRQWRLLREAEERAARDTLIGCGIVAGIVLVALLITHFLPA